MSMLVRLLNAVARRAGLVVTPSEAAAAILASNVGVTLSLIAQPVAERDQGISNCVREAVLSSVLVPSGAAAAGVDGSRWSRQTAAIAMSAALDDDPDGLTTGEKTLLYELLAQLSGSSSVR